MLRSMEQHQKLSLALEARHPFRIVGKLRRQNLQCDIAAKPLIFRPIHLAYAAHAELAGNLIGCECFPDHGPMSLRLN